MKKIIVTALILGLFSLPALESRAASTKDDADRKVDTELSSIHHKLKRGLVNLVSFPLEIPKQTKSVVENGPDSTPKKVALVVPGLIKGVGYSTIRLISGLVDIGTFNVNLPKDYKPVLEPEFVWEGMTAE